MKFRVVDKDVGEVVITTVNDLAKSEEYTVKSLCMLQIMCMNNRSDPAKLGVFLDIIQDAINKANALYNGPGIDNDTTDPTGHFGD